MDGGGRPPRSCAVVPPLLMDKSAVAVEAQTRSMTFPLSVPVDILPRVGKIRLGAWRTLCHLAKVNFDLLTDTAPPRLS